MCVCCRGGEELCPGVLRSGVQVLQPQQGHVGGEDVPASAPVAALGEWMLQGKLKERSQIFIYFVDFYVLGNE